MDDSNPVETVKTFWENTYRQNISKMIGVGYRYTADRQIAEDLAQDAFIIAYQKAGSFKGKGPFEAWLRRIMVNVCLQYLREQNKKKYLDNWLKNETTTVETYEENINYQDSDFTETALLEAINKLPEHHKLVFNLYVLDTFTHAQIGKELGISEGTSKSHLARARKKIKDFLNEKPGAEKKEKKKTIFPLFSRNIDSLYKKRFKDFGLASRKKFSFDPIYGQPASAPTISPSIPILKKLSGFHIASTLTVTITAIVCLPFLYKTKHPKEISEKIKSPDFYTSNNAPIRKNDSMLNENKVLNKNPEKNTTAQDVSLTNKANNTTTVPTPTPDKHQSNTDSNVTINAKRNSNFKADFDVTGTFYAEKLYWSAENNELYFQGKSIIAFGEKNYVSDSSTSFLGKVYYLVIDGKIVKLEDKAKKDIKLSEKKYSLAQLSPNSAVKKYGEEGKKGAIEISLAE